MRHQQKCIYERKKCIELILNMWNIAALIYSSRVNLLYQLSPWSALTLQNTSIILNVSRVTYNFAFFFFYVSQQKQQKNNTNHFVTFRSIHSFAYFNPTLSRSTDNNRFLLLFFSSRLVLFHWNLLHSHFNIILIQLYKLNYINHQPSQLCTTYSMKKKNNNNNGKQPQQNK